MIRKQQGGSTYSKCSAIWNAYRQIRKDSKQTIRQRRLECKVMRDFMNGKEKILVRRSTNDVGCDQELQ